MLGSDMQTLAGTQDFAVEVAACLGKPWEAYVPPCYDEEGSKGQAHFRDREGRELTFRWSPYDAEGRLLVSAHIEKPLSRHVNRWEDGSAKGTFGGNKDAGQIVKELRARVLPKIADGLAQAKASLAGHLAGHTRTAEAAEQIAKALRAAGLEPSLRWELGNGTPEVESCAATVDYFSGERGGELGVRCWGAENPVSVHLSAHVNFTEALRMLEGLKV